MGTDGFGLPFLFIAMAVMGKFPLLLSPAAYAPTYHRK